MFKKFKCCLEKLCRQENTHSKCKKERYEAGIGVLATSLNTEDELSVFLRTEFFRLWILENKF